jgi:hypothetical protein
MSGISQETAIKRGFKVGLPKDTAFDRYLAPKPAP